MSGSHLLQVLKKRNSSSMSRESSFMNLAVKPKKAPLPIRKSSRLRGEKPLAIEIDKENNIELLNDEIKVRPSKRSIMIYT